MVYWKSPAYTRGALSGQALFKILLPRGLVAKRIGLDIDSKAPCRAGTEIFVGDMKVGEITSGGFGPSVGKPVAMGYIATEYSAVDTAVILRVRKKQISATVCKMPFIPHKYKR